MKNKGFTLVELLAVIVVLAVISLISVPMILGVVEEAKKSSFKDSVLSAFDAVEYYIIDNDLGDVPENGIAANLLEMKNNNFESGRFIKNIDGNLIAEFVSDGRYCATGSLTNLNVSKGECEINSPSVVIAVNGKEATITLTDDNGIVAYAFTTSSDEPTEWLNVVETTSITETKTAEVAGTYYIHVKNKYGKVSTKEYVIEQNAFCAYNAGDIVGTFDYSGSPEEFIVPCDGTYKLEVWGAQGGYAIDSTNSSGGYGGYSRGNITLEKGQKLNIVVGGKGIDALEISSATLEGGYNGGGSSTGDSNTVWGSGGGATHIALGNTNRGVLSNYLNYKSEILIVAGGGGGGGTYGSHKNKGGHAGGYIGGSGTGPAYGTGGTQTEAGIGNGSYKANGGFGAGGGGVVASGGGAGYFGGGTGYEHASGAGGGSSYIGNSLLTDKVMYCYDCTPSSVASTKTISTNIAEQIPTVGYAKKENGYAKITYIGN